MDGWIDERMDGVIDGRMMKKKRVKENVYIRLTSNDPLKTLATQQQQQQQHHNYNINEHNSNKNNMTTTTKTMPEQ